MLDENQIAAGFIFVQAEEQFIASDCMLAAHPLSNIINKIYLWH